LGRFNSGGQAGGGSAGAIPTGVIMPYGGIIDSSLPAGFVACLGQAISRVTFADLFAVIGTQYGIGDGSTTFNVPDFRTNESLPRAGLTDAARGTTGGSATQTLTIANLAAHTHGIPSGNVDSGTLGNARFGNFIDNRVTTVSVGSGTAHNNEAPFVDVNYIIKL